MACRRFFLGLVFSLLCVSAASAILIEANGTRVGGALVSDDGKKLTIRVRTPDGKEKDTDFDRAKTKIKIVHQLDRKRLESLAKTNPQAYRAYADELAEQKADPEARDVAMRLFLIAAFLDPQKLGPKSMLGMCALASSPAEARKYRAMAYLLDPEGDPRALTTNADKHAQPTKAEAAALQTFLKALQDYRSGKINSARELAARDGIDKIFAMAPGMIDQKTFLKRCAEAACTSCTKGKMTCSMCAGTGTVRGMLGDQQVCPLCAGKRVTTCTVCDGTGFQASPPDDILRVMLRAELWALDLVLGEPAKETGAETTWSSLIQSRQVSPVLPLSLETLTEFDPRKCIYRDGKWVVP